MIRSVGDQTSDGLFKKVTAHLLYADCALFRKEDNDNPLTSIVLAPNDVSQVCVLKTIPCTYTANNTLVYKVKMEKARVKQ